MIAWLAARCASLAPRRSRAASECACVWGRTFRSLYLVAVVYFPRNCVVRLFAAYARCVCFEIAAFFKPCSALYTFYVCVYRSTGCFVVKGTKREIYTAQYGGIMRKIIYTRASRGSDDRIDPGLSLTHVVFVLPPAFPATSTLFFWHSDCHTQSPHHEQSNIAQNTVCVEYCRAQNTAGARSLAGCRRRPSAATREDTWQSHRRAVSVADQSFPTTSRLLSTTKAGSHCVTGCGRCQLERPASGLLLELECSPAHTHTPFRRLLMHRSLVFVSTVIAPRQCT